MSDEPVDRVFGEEEPIDLMPAVTPQGKRLDEMSGDMFGFNEPMHYDRQGRPCTMGRSVELMEGLGGNPWVGYDLGRGFIVSTRYEGMRGIGWEEGPRTFRTVVFTTRAPLDEIYVSYTPNEVVADVIHRHAVRQYIGGPSKWLRRRQGQAMHQRDRYLNRWHRMMQRRRMLRHYGSGSPWKKPR